MLCAGWCFLPYFMRIPAIFDSGNSSFLLNSQAEIWRVCFFFSEPFGPNCLIFPLFSAQEIKGRILLWFLRLIRRQSKAESTHTPNSHKKCLKKVFLKPFFSSSQSDFSSFSTCSMLALYEFFFPLLLPSSFQSYRLSPKGKGGRRFLPLLVWCLKGRKAFASSSLQIVFKKGTFFNPSPPHTFTHPKIKISFVGTQGCSLFLHFYARNFRNSKNSRNQTLASTIHVTHIFWSFPDSLASLFPNARSHGSPLLRTQRLTVD